MLIKLLYWVAYQPHVGLRGMLTAAFGVPTECEMIFSGFKLKYAEDLVDSALRLGVLRED